jgi:3-hydroxyisobutyrate dehydrogenase
LTASISDSFALAKALDFPEEEVGAVFDIFNLGSSIQARTKRIRSRDYAHPTWELAMARKDARLMQEEAELSGIHLPLISAVGKQMDQFIADGHGNDDWLLFTKHSLR